METTTRPQRAISGNPAPQKSTDARQYCRGSLPLVGNSGERLQCPAGRPDLAAGYPTQPPPRHETWHYQQPSLPPTYRPSQTTANTRRPLTKGMTSTETTVSSMDENLDWKLPCFNIAKKHTNTAFLQNCAPEMPHFPNSIETSATRHGQCMWRCDIVSELAKVPTFLFLEGKQCRSYNMQRTLSI